MENLGHETSKYCFSILFRNDDGETRWWRCFQKKYIRPCPWLSMLYFFPRVPLFFIAFFSLRKARAADWLRNFETKTLIRSEIESTSQFPVSFLFFFLRQKWSEIVSDRVKKGRIVQKFFWLSINPRNRIFIELSIDRLIKNDILQEKRKHRDKVRTLTVSFSSAIHEIIHELSQPRSDFSCNDEWRADN